MKTVYGLNDSLNTSGQSVSSQLYYKCVVVGDGGVGKTSMLIRFVQGDFLTEYAPTDFDSFTVTMALGKEWAPCTMTLVDTAGQETYDRLRTLTYSETDVFIVCFSVACRDSFVNVRARWLPELREFKPKVPVLLVGTQTDLRDDPSAQCVTHKEGKRLAHKLGCRMYAECSSLNGVGLDKIFYEALMTAAVPKRKKRLWHGLKKLFSNG